MQNNNDDNDQQQLQIQLDQIPIQEQDRINPSKKIQRGRIKRQFNKLRTEDFDIKKRIKMQKNICTKLGIICKNLQNQIWIILEEPDSSNFALFIQYLLLSAIFLSCGVIIYDSLVSERDDQNNQISKQAETVLFILFSCEYGLRLVTSTAFDKKFVDFLISPMNLTDLIAILPFLFNLFIEDSSLSSLKIMRAVKFLRVFRIFKISRYIKGISLLSVTIRKSFKDLFVLAYIFFVLVMVFSTLIYQVEKVGQSFETLYTENEKINSMTDAIWWSFVTMTTVGYGDKIPVTIEGKFIACIAAFFGITTISLPVAVLGVTFSSALTSNLEAEEVNKIKQGFTENHQGGHQKEQLDLKELEFMEKRLDLLYENNVRIMDLIETSQQLFDDVTRQLINLFMILTNELDMHLDENLKSMKAKERIMKLEKNNYMKNQLDLRMIAAKLRESEEISKKCSRSLLMHDDVESISVISKKVRRKSVKESLRERRKLESSGLSALSQKPNDSRQSSHDSLSNLQKSPINKEKNEDIIFVEQLESDKSPEVKSFIVPVDKKPSSRNFLELDNFVRKSKCTLPTVVGIDNMNDVEFDEVSRKIDSLHNMESEVHQNYHSVQGKIKKLPFNQVCSKQNQQTRQTMQYLIVRQCTM